MIQKNDVALVSPSFIGTDFDWSILDPGLVLKKMSAQRFQGPPFYEVFLFSCLSITVAFFSDTLKVTSVDVTTQGPFLIGCFKVSLQCVVIGWTEP